MFPNAFALLRFYFSPNPMKPSDWRGFSLGLEIFKVGITSEHFNVSNWFSDILNCLPPILNWHIVVYRTLLPCGEACNIFHSQQCGYPSRKTAGLLLLHCYGNETPILQLKFKRLACARWDHYCLPSMGMKALVILHDWTHKQVFISYR